MFTMIETNIVLLYQDSSTLTNIIKYYLFFLFLNASVDNFSDGDIVKIILEINDNEVEVKFSGSLVKY